MKSKEVKLIEYSKRVDFFNCLTHFVGAVLSVVALVMLLMKAQGLRETVAFGVYGITMVAVYAVSAFYHGLPKGELKRKARLADHMTVPLLIAGTATPCALISLYRVNVSAGIFVFTLGWLCTLFGIFSKLFFFEKLKNITMTVYIVSGAVMLMSVLPLLDEINSAAFGELVLGAFLYLTGAVFCGLGVKRPFFHVVFHIFVMLGSAVHFYVIYVFV